MDYKASARSRKMIRLFSLSIILLVGCGPDREANVYNTPKEENQKEQSNSVPSAPFASSDMAGRSLPSSALNQTGNLPEWSAPDSWQEAAASQMRKASYSVPGIDGLGDFSVTSFPGDVGGLVANVNRWRRQIGLPPQSEASIINQSDSLNIEGQPFTLLEIIGAEQATLAAITMVEGNSWFFKLTGPRTTVKENEPEFRSFINSVRF